MYPIFTRYLYNMCLILYWPISIWYLYDMYKICARYYTTRYMCNMCTISIIYITELLHKHYRYQVPDMCVIVAYRIHIIYISYIYLVPDMQPIASILTCEMTKVACLNLFKILRLVSSKFYYRFIIVSAEFQQFRHL